MLVCELRISNFRCLLFVVFYRLFDIGEVFLEEFRRFFNNVFIFGVVDNIIFGDFNFFSVDWFIGLLIIVDSLIEVFCEIFDDFFFI